MGIIVTNDVTQDCTDHHQLPYKNGGEVMLKAKYGKAEYLSVKWVFRKFHRYELNKAQVQTHAQKDCKYKPRLTQ
ncbi:MAG: hypothetical protein ACXQS5_07555, partial [Candidatus Methanospirareceae archaeon]